MDSSSECNNARLPLHAKARPARTISGSPERYSLPASHLSAARFPVALFVPGIVLASVLLLVHAIVPVRPAHGQWDEQIRDPSRCVPDIGKEVVTREDIVRYGFFRLADALAFSTRWHTAGLEGYHWQTAPPGFPDGAARWSLYIDDIPVASRVLGRNRLNALPISLSDVACIEIISGMDMEGSAFLREGALRMYTKNPGFGLSMAGSVAVGNEINDPGPFRYTLPETINIDRIGPVHAASMSVGKNAWQGHASGRLDELHVTDAALRDRARRLYYIPGTQTHIRTRALGFAGTFGSHSRSQRILAGLSHTGDMAFFPETGFEVPTLHRTALLGAAGTLPLGSSGLLRYAVSSSRDALELRQNREDADLDWTQRQFAAEAGAHVRMLHVGGQVRTTEGQTSGPLSDANLFDLRLFGGLNARTGQRGRTRLILEWIRREERSGAVAYASMEMQPGAKQRFRLAGSYGVAPPDARSLWLWQERGYQLPYSKFRGTGRKQKPLPRRVTIDAGWMRRGLSGISGDIFVFYRGFRNDILPEYTITWDGDNSSFETMTRLLPGADGHTRGISGAMAFRLLPTLRQRVSGTFETVRRDGPLWLAYGERIPRLRIAAITTLAAADRFSLSVFMQYASATRWPEYREASIEAGEVWPWRLPERFLLNLTAAKRIAGDHLNVSLSLRNLLNEPTRFHPAGAVFYMEFYVAVAARFTSAAGF